MSTPKRILLALVSSIAAWALLWNGGTQLASRIWPEHLLDVGMITHIGLLIGYIVYSVGLSILAGILTARIVKVGAALAVQLLATIQLAIGIAVQASAWELFPLWYHLVFLALVVPATLVGGGLGVRGIRRK